MTLHVVQRSAMNDFLSAIKPVVPFIAFFIPGFVSTRVFDLLVSGQRRDYGKAVYEIAGYSMFTYAILSPLLFAYAIGWRPALWLDGVMLIIVLFLVPAMLPIAFLFGVRKWLASHVVDPCPSAWDWGFQVNKAAMVLVHLRDGRLIGGTWDRSALSSSYPVTENLYLSEVWNVDQDTGAFIERARHSKGVFIFGSDIELVEFFDLDETRKEANERKKQRHPKEPERVTSIA